MLDVDGWFFSTKLQSVAKKSQKTSDIYSFSLMTHTKESVALSGRRVFVTYDGNKDTSVITIMVLAGEGLYLIK